MPDVACPLARNHRSRWAAVALVVSLLLLAGGPVVADSKDPTVYVTKTGSKYHSAGCRSLAKSAIPMRLSEAARRYDPCKVCRPPTLGR